MTSMRVSMRSPYVASLFFLLLLPLRAVGMTLVDNDFNGNSWGGMSAGSFWSIQSSGGVNNSAAARLEYSISGTANKALSLNVGSVQSNEFWFEFDVKIEGPISGGSKFVKLFGSSTASQNNMTIGLDYYTNTQVGVSYYMDTLCVARYAGVNAGSCVATFHHSSGPIDMRGGSWGHYKLWVKRASPGEKNGEVKVWWNGSLRAHIAEMDSNPLGSSTPHFERVEIGGYNHNNFDGNPWFLWVDNLYIGTTEKKTNGSPRPMPPSGFRATDD